MNQIIYYWTIFVQYHIYFLDKESGGSEVYRVKEFNLTLLETMCVLVYKFEN